MIQAAHGKKIMVVDDQADVRTSFVKLLTCWGYAVVEASTGKEALEKLDAEQPDFILLDLGMPGMTGLDVAAAIRSKGSGNQPTLIAHTGHAGQLHEQLTRQLGFDFMMVKPVDPEDLRKVLGWYS